jgi:hypothetical protein
MPNVPIDKLQSGMKLAKPLLRGSMVILGEGTVLNDTWISRIADMGVDYVFIDGPSEQTVPKEVVLAQLDARFRHVDDSPYMKQLRQIVKKHLEGLYG